MTLFGRKPKTKHVVIYGMGRDGGGAVYDVLAGLPDVNVQRIYTLDRAKITSVMLSGGTVPEHVHVANDILQNRMRGDTPITFVTMVANPFWRHVRQSFYTLRQQVDNGILGQVLLSASTNINHFNSVPFEQTLQWFNTEYLPATGIDVYKLPFDKLAGYAVHKIGIHRLVLISEQANAQEVLSEILNMGIPPIVPRSHPYDGLQDLYFAHLFNSARQDIVKSFWFSQYAQHFFDAEYLTNLQNELITKANMTLMLNDSLDGLKVKSLRDQTLDNALIMQVQTLTEQLTEAVEKRGHDTVYNMVDSLLRQLERAQRNLLLAGMRSLGQQDTKIAIELAEKWDERPKDLRIARSLATYYQRNSGIIKPLALLQSLPECDDKTQQQIDKLASMATMMSLPFDLPARAECSYTPINRNILYSPHQCLPVHTSGYATRTHGIVKGLAQHGWNVQVFARAGYPVDTGKEAPDNQLIDGIPYYFDHRAGVGQHDLPLCDYIHLAADYLVGHGKAMRAAVVHGASNYICGMAAILAARRLGVPSVYEMRGLWHITFWSKDPDYAQTDKFTLAQKMELECAAQADHVLAITGALKEWLIDNGIAAEKISLAPNAVDTTQFQAREKDEDFANEHGLQGKIVVGYIGSFVQYEGLDYLIEALALLPADVREQVKFLWVGDGPVLRPLLELAQELGVREHIVSLGRRPFDEMPRAYSVVDIAAFPRKGQVICEIVSPLKPFEAMAMGKAVLVSSVRPLAEIVEHGVTGLVHTKDDAHSLAQQLERFVRDADLRATCGKNAREWIENTRRWDVIAGDISNIYGEIINGREKENSSGDGGAAQYDEGRAPVSRAVGY